MNIPLVYYIIICHEYHQDFVNIPSFIDDFPSKPPFVESFALLKIFVARDLGRIGALASGGVFGPGLGWSKKVAVATHMGLANGEYKYTEILVLIEKTIIDQ